MCHQRTSRDKYSLTIEGLHISFAQLVSHSFSGHRANRPGATKWAGQNGMASNRGKLPQRSFSVAQTVLDRLEFPRVLALSSYPSSSGRCANILMCRASKG